VAFRVHAKATPTSNDYFTGNAPSGQSALLRDGVRGDGSARTAVGAPAREDTRGTQEDDHEARALEAALLCALAAGIATAQVPAPGAGGGTEEAKLRVMSFNLRFDNPFWLSETPDVKGSRGWDAALPRIVTWGRLRDRHTGAAFHVFNTHFDHQREEARRRSAELLLRRVDEIARGRRSFVFVSAGIDVLRHGILSDTFDGRFPSDHLPVLAEVAIAP
jgi:hypothetical protein